MWPTARAEDSESAGRRHGRDVSDTLTAASRDFAAIWQTPATDSFRSRGGDRKDEMGLDQQARAFTIEGHWTTPCADDTGMRSKRCSQGGTLLSTQAGIHALTWPTPQASDDQRKATKASHQKMLCNLAPHWSPECPSPPAQVIRAGPQSSSERRSLNPLFVEWLMGWPIGWTDCERAATGLSPWLQRSRGILSTLLSPPIEPEQASLF